MTIDRDTIETELEIAVRSYEIELSSHSDGTSRAYHVSAEREFLLDTLSELHGRAVAVGDERVIARVESVWQWLDGMDAPTHDWRTRVVVGAEDPEMVDYLRDVLTDDGYEVLGFGASDLSLDRLAAANPDVLLLDIELDALTPIGSGLDLLRLARGDQRLARVPVIVCPTNRALLLRHAADLRELSRVYLLPRPFELSELEQLLSELRGGASTALRRAGDTAAGLRPTGL